MSLSAPKLDELYLECYLEDSIVGCAKNERWRLYELKLEMSKRHRDGEQETEPAAHPIALHRQRHGLFRQRSLCYRTSSLH